MRVNNPAEKSVKSFRKLGLGAALLVSVPLTLASISPAMGDDDSGWYVGADAGQSRAKIDDTRIRANLATAGFTTTALKDGDKHFGYKLFGGYQFIKYFALEGGYFDLGRFGFTANTAPSGGLTGEAKFKGEDIDAVGILPFTDKFAAFGRIGYAYTDVKDRFVGYGPVGVANPQRSQHSSNYKYGFGLQYAVTPAWGMRAEGERYRVADAVGNKGDIDMYSLGVLYRFGKTYAPMPIVQAAPPPAPHIAAAEPIPEPAPVAPPPPPLRKNVSFSADSLFDFGKDTVKPQGKQALQKFAAELKGAQFEVITVTGYSDRIGSHEYNMKLSTRRAEAVKSYLVEAAGIPDGKVTARGADGSDPVTKPDQCKGERRSAELIACLQPDRRVEVEVSASRLEPQH